MKEQKTLAVHMHRASSRIVCEALIIMAFLSSSSFCRGERKNEYAREFRRAIVSSHQSSVYIYSVYILHFTI